MNIRVNGVPSEVPDGITVAQMVEALDVAAGARGVAVAVDAEVVPRGRWEEARVHEGAVIEIVQAVQGG